MQTLERVHKSSQNSESLFQYKKVLFVGSESYDAPTITVLQGLEKLGFDIFVLKKPNINSWFCNQIVESIDALRFDFVLSNLHWGTRWSYYSEFGLSRYPKVLIDGDDNLRQAGWRDKFDAYISRYQYDPPEHIKDQHLMPYRWVEPLGDYQPDIVFTSQKQQGDNTSIYLPFGIHEQYRAMSKGAAPRPIDFAHIPGPGRKRRFTRNLIRVLSSTGVLPGHVVNGPVSGEETVPAAIRDLTKEDDNVHSYHRWITRQAYFDLLNSTKVLIYPGIDSWPFWDSKRPWEAYACGCLVLMSHPSIDVTEYPITEICGFAVYESARELISKWRFLYKNQGFLESARIKAVRRASDYFSPSPIARYFLMQVAKQTGPGSAE